MPRVKGAQRVLVLPAWYEDNHACACERMCVCVCERMCVCYASHAHQCVKLPLITNSQYQIWSTCKRALIQSSSVRKVVHKRGSELLHTLLLLRDDAVGLSSRGWRRGEADLRAINAAD